MDCTVFAVIDDVNLIDSQEGVTSPGKHFVIHKTYGCTGYKEAGPDTCRTLINWDGEYITLAEVPGPSLTWDIRLERAQKWYVQKVASYTCTTCYYIGTLECGEGTQFYNEAECKRWVREGAYLVLGSSPGSVFRIRNVGKSYNDLIWSIEVGCGSGEYCAVSYSRSYLKVREPGAGNEGVFWAFIDYHFIDRAAIARLQAQYRGSAMDDRW